MRVLVTLLILAALAVPASVPVPAAAAPRLDFCHDVNTECGATSFPQGVPWIVFRLHDPGGGPFEVQSWGPDATSPDVSRHHPGPVRTFYLRSVQSMDVRIRETADGQRMVRIVLPRVGEHRVRVLRGGNVIAEATYTVTPQTPMEAWEAWQGALGGWRMAGAVLAQWRMGNVERAVAHAEKMSRLPDELDRFWGASLRYEIAMALERWDDAVGAARDMLKIADQPFHRVMLIRALLAGCRLDEAEAEIRSAMREWMGLPLWPPLLTELFKARARCG